MKSMSTRADRREFHTAEMKARRERQMAATEGFQPVFRTAPQPKQKSTEQRYQMQPDGSYRVYHATKGWRRVSAERVGAQIKMAELLDGQAPREGLMQRMLAKMAKIAGGSAANDQMLENEAA